MHLNHPESTDESLNLAERAGRIGANFDRAAPHYDGHAHVQRDAAESLAERIKSIVSDSPAQRILEIGCGTGHLTQQLVDIYPLADWTITDISPSMVDRCRQKIQAHELARTTGKRDFQVVDALTLSLDGKFDLICSNLTFQWFPKLHEAVIALVDCLQPGGALIFNTLGAKSFNYWRELDAQVGGASSAPVFATAEMIAEELTTYCQSKHEERLTIEVSAQQFERHHASFLAFLQSLKIIGAGMRMDSRPTSIAHLRNLVCRSLQQDPQGVTSNYEVITVAVACR